MSFPVKAEGLFFYFYYMDDVGMKRVRRKAIGILSLITRAAKLNWPRINPESTEFHCAPGGLRAAFA